MRCENCGGLCEWRGPLTDLSQTKCLRCGGVNTVDLWPDGPVEEDNEPTQGEHRE